MVHTYRALGASHDHAWMRAQSQTRRVVRRVARAWQALGVPPEERPVLTVSQFTEHPRYRSLRAHHERLFVSDPQVRAVFWDASRRALSARMKGVEPSVAQQEKNARYLLAELPLCLDTPGILGVPSSVNIYHQVIRFVPLLISRPELRASTRQAFAVVRAPHAACQRSEDDGQAVGPKEVGT